MCSLKEGEFMSSEQQKREQMKKNVEGQVKKIEETKEGKEIKAEGKEKEEKKEKVEEDKKTEGKPSKTPVESAKAKRKKKINQFTLKEINQKIEEVKEKMGGLNSKYAKQLLHRKEILEKIEK